MKLKKILALAAAAVLLLACTACGGDKTPADDTTVPETVVETVVEETVAPVEEDTTVEEETEAATEEATEAETEAAEDENKTPSTVEEIVEFYKKAATETDKTQPKTKTQMTLTSLDGGNGGVGKLISAIEPIGKKALEKNSTEDTGLTGGYTNLSAADVTSATATDDGKVTSVKINLKQQVDGMNGKSKEGSVGHGVSVLDGMQTAIDELNGVSIDASKGKATLTYNNAYIDVKIDNATGKIVSGTWHHTVNVALDNVDAKVAIISATLDGARVVIDYTVTMM